MWKNLGIKCHDACIPISSGRAMRNGGGGRERNRGKKKHCGQVVTKIKTKQRSQHGM